LGEALKRPFDQGLRLGAGSGLARHDDLLAFAHEIAPAEIDAALKRDGPTRDAEAPALAIRQKDEHAAPVACQRGAHIRMQMESDREGHGRGWRRKTRIGREAILAPQIAPLTVEKEAPLMQELELIDIGVMGTPEPAPLLAITGCAFDLARPAATRPGSSLAKSPCSMMRMVG